MTAPPIHVDEQSLYAAVLAEPRDNVCRLTLADWLEERGQSERSELIRVGVEMTKFPAPPGEMYHTLKSKSYVLSQIADWDEAKTFGIDLYLRQQQLLDTHGANLLLPGMRRQPHLTKIELPDSGYVLHASDLIAGVDRGFVGRLTLSGEDCAKHLDAIRKRLPIVEVTLTSDVIGLPPEEWSAFQFLKNTSTHYQKRWPGVRFRYAPINAGWG